MSNKTEIVRCNYHITVIENRLIDNPKLSYEDIGLMIYLLRHTEENTPLSSKYDYRDNILELSSFKKLVKLGYIEKVDNNYYL